MDALRKSALWVVCALASVGLFSIIGGIAWWISPDIWVPEPPIGKNELFKLENRTEWQDPVYQNRPGNIVPESETADFFLRRYKAVFAGEQYSLVNPPLENATRLLKEGEWSLVAIVGYSDDPARAETIAKDFRTKVSTHSVRKDAVHGETIKGACCHDLKVDEGDLVVTLERVLGPKGRIWIRIGKQDGQYGPSILPFLCQRGWKFEKDSLSGAVPHKLLRMLYDLRTSCADPARTGYNKPSVNDPFGEDIQVEVRFLRPVPES